MTYHSEEDEVYIYPTNHFFSNKLVRSVLNIELDIGRFNIDFLCSGFVYSPGCGSVSLKYSIRKKNRHLLLRYAKNAIKTN